MAVLSCNPSALAVRRFADSRPEDLGHLSGYLAWVEAYRQEELRHVGATYLDYAGAALYSQEQVRAASAAMLEGLLANPHTSPAMEEAVRSARGLVLGMFGVREETHSLVFTSGATHGLQLVGESFPWEAGSVFVYAGESHTSVVGLRQYALRAGAHCGHFALEALPGLATGLKSAVPLGGEPGKWPREAEGDNARNLLAVPGESNFSGERVDLASIAALRTGRMRWRVLLDAAKLACSPGVLDLSSCPADYAVISFYKIFGMPTGLGALIARHDAAALLAPRGTLGTTGPQNAFGPAYFGGGTVSSISASSEFAVPRPSVAFWLERGTLHFQGIAVLASQLQTLRSLASDAQRRQHTESVCHEAFLQMRGLTHSSGRRLCHILGRHGDVRWREVQGPTISLTLQYPDGSPVPYGLVRERAVERGILLRVGCHCNAGGCQRHLGLSDADVRHFFASGKVCGDDLGLVDGRPTGVVRLSFGFYSTLGDVAEWMRLLREEFLDASAEAIAESCPTCKAPQPTLQVDHSDLTAVQPPKEELPLQPHWPPVPAVESEPGVRGRGRLVGLKVYPIKGCGPLQVKHWPLDPGSGALFLDRRWCIAPRGRQRLRPISAKQAPQLTQVQLSLDLPAPASPHREPSLRLSAPGQPGVLSLPLSASDATLLQKAGAEAEALADNAPVVEDLTPSQWFQQLLDLPDLELVEAAATPGTGEAPVTSTHFANAPSTLLMVSTASLQSFGRLCGLAVPAKRFRANLEVDFKVPFEEDSWPMGLPLIVGETNFEAAGRCVRCQAVDVDPEDPGARGPSLLAALATSQTGGPHGKGPTFGVLLRPCFAAKRTASIQVLSLGMELHTRADGQEHSIAEGDSY